MICQAYGVEAPTKYVSFHQNIGALVMRFSKSVEGELCKSCIHQHFWSLTGTTFLLGWWGTISLVITPFLLLNNVGRYMFCLGMEAVAPGAQRPTLTDEDIARIEPHAQYVFDRLNAGDELLAISKEVANMARVTPAQVMLFVHAVVSQSQQ